VQRHRTAMRAMIRGATAFKQKGKQFCAGTACFMCQLGARMCRIDTSSSNMRVQINDIE
jgi:hypothetical protein